MILGSNVECDHTRTRVFMMTTRYMHALAVLCKGPAPTTDGPASDSADGEAGADSEFGQFGNTMQIQLAYDVASVNLDRGRCDIQKR